MCDIDYKKIINTNKNVDKPITLKSLLTYVCKVSDTNIHSLRGNRRFRELAEARHAFILLADKELHANHDKIVKEINKDRCTIFHARKNEDIPNIKRIVETVKQLYL